MLGLKMGQAIWQGIQQFLGEWSLMTASKEMGTSVQQPQETEFCHNPVCLEDDPKLMMTSWLTIYDCMLVKL